MIGLNRLKDKVALITGAGQGIGQIMAEVFSLEGASVIIADIQKEKGEKAAAAIRRRKKLASFVQVDLRDEKEIKKMIRFAKRQFGKLDILINNAAPFRERLPFERQSVKDWNLNLDVLLKAPMLTAKHALPLMEKNRGGSIVNIASVVGFAITHEPCSYHVAKAGMIHLTRYLAYELGPKGIRVNCICPGIVDRKEGNALTMDPINRAAAEISVPLKRAGTALDVAYAAVYLCSPEASYVTGHSLILDGGLELGETFGVARQAYKAGQKESKHAG